jgi:hypothetical protein
VAAMATAGELGAVYSQNCVCLLPKTGDEVRRLKRLENDVAAYAGAKGSRARPPRLVGEPRRQSDQPPPDRERRQSQQERGQLDGLWERILRFCCSKRVPELLVEPGQKYLGPSILLQPYRRLPTAAISAPASGLIGSRTRDISPSPRHGSIEPNRSACDQPEDHDQEELGRDLERDQLRQRRNDDVLSDIGQRPPLDGKKLVASLGQKVHSRQVIGVIK